MKCHLLKLTILTSVAVKKPDSVKNLASEEGDEKLKITAKSLDILSQNTPHLFNRTNAKNFFSKSLNGNYKSLSKESSL